MPSKTAAAILTALIYVQGFLCVAGAASVLLRDRITTQDVAIESPAPASGPVRL